MDQNGNDDLKTQFVTREGTYRLITLSEYSRPNRVGYQSNQNNPQVRVSLLPAKQKIDAVKVTNVTNNTSTNSVNIKLRNHAKIFIFLSQKKKRKKSLIVIAVIVCLNSRER